MYFNLIKIKSNPNPILSRGTLTHHSSLGPEGRRATVTVTDPVEVAALQLHGNFGVLVQVIVTGPL